MKKNGRLPVALHLLIHLAERSEPVTSDELAACVHTNPVVVRRTMAGLRDAQLVSSERGHGGGWLLVREAGAITLRDVYAALGSPLLFNIDERSGSLGCMVTQAVTAALQDAMGEAEAVLLSRLGGVTLADLAADVGHRVTAGRRGRKGAHRTH